MKVYIKAEESVCVNHAQVYLCDVLSLYCSDYETGEKLKKVRLYHFPSREKQRKIFSVLKVVEKIKEEDSQIEVVNMGPEDFVVSYEQKKRGKEMDNCGKDYFCMSGCLFWSQFFHYVLQHRCRHPGTVFQCIWTDYGEKRRTVPTSCIFPIPQGWQPGSSYFLIMQANSRSAMTRRLLKYRCVCMKKTSNNTLMIDADREKVEEDVDT